MFRGSLRVAEGIGTAGQMVVDDAVEADRARVDDGSPDERGQRPAGLLHPVRSPCGTSDVRDVRDDEEPVDIAREGVEPRLHDAFGQPFGALRVAGGPPQ